ARRLGRARQRGGRLGLARSHHAHLSAFGVAQSGGAEALGLFGIHHHHPPAVFGAYVPDHDRGPRRRDERAGAVAPSPAGQEERKAQSTPQTIHRGIKSLIDEANAAIETVSAADAIKAAQDPGVVIVDIRDPREIERDGKIPGAFSCTRGMLEFWIDPQSPYAKPIFQEDKKFIFHCAGGLRSALAAKTAQDMGLKPVAHMGGGFAAWRDAGGPIEKWEPKKTT